MHCEPTEFTPLSPFLCSITVCSIAETIKLIIDWKEVSVTYSEMSMMIWNIYSQPLSEGQLKQLAILFYRNLWNDRWIIDMKCLKQAPFGGAGEITGEWTLLYLFCRLILSNYLGCQMYGDRVHIVVDVSM